MPLGPGKYDDACTKARLATGAHTTVLIVLGGTLGLGFSVQTEDPSFVATLPEVLRALADEIAQSDG